MELPKRKQIRLKGYDYSQLGYYFLTICCKDRKCYLGNISSMGVQRAERCTAPTTCPTVELSGIGEIISEQWYELKNRYPHIQLDQFVVMPNHIHGIMIIENTWAEQKPAPAVSHIICSYKSITTKLSNKFDNTPGRVVWQKSYYDHIIRGDDDLQKIRQYIDNNPAKWQEDEYFTY